MSVVGTRRRPPPCRDNIQREGIAKKKKKKGKRLFGKRPEEEAGHSARVLHSFLGEFLALECLDVTFEARERGEEDWGCVAVVKESGMSRNGGRL